MRTLDHDGLLLRQQLRARFLDVAARLRPEMRGDWDRVRAGQLTVEQFRQGYSLDWPDLSPSDFCVPGLAPHPAIAVWLSQLASDVWQDPAVTAAAELLLRYVEERSAPELPDYSFTFSVRLPPCKDAEELAETEAICRAALHTRCARYREEILPLLKRSGGPVLYLPDDTALECCAMDIVDGLPASEIAGKIHHDARVVRKWLNDTLPALGLKFRPSAGGRPRNSPARRKQVIKP